MAKPSFSQMSFQVAGETLSPYHWWASSWATISSIVGSPYAAAYDSMISRPKMHSVWSSRAPGTPGTRAWPYSAKG